MLGIRTESLFAFRPRLRSQDWSNQELAEFYRVQYSLSRAQVPVESDRGLSDEGDPWFTFCDPASGEVLVHFARIDGEYVVASQAFEECLRGRDFRALIEAQLEKLPLVVPKPREGARLYVHPAAILILLVATCYFKLSQGVASAEEWSRSHKAIGVGSTASDAGPPKPAVALDDFATAALLTAIAAGSEWQRHNSLFLPPGGTEAAELVAASPNSDPWPGALELSNSSRIWLHSLRHDGARATAESLEDLPPQDFHGHLGQGAATPDATSVEVAAAEVGASHVPAPATSSLTNWAPEPAQTLPLGLPNLSSRANPASTPSETPTLAAGEIKSIGISLPDPSVGHLTINQREILSYATTQPHASTPTPVAGPAQTPESTPTAGATATPGAAPSAEANAASAGRPSTEANASGGGGSSSGDAPSAEASAGSSGGPSTEANASGSGGSSSGTGASATTSSVNLTPAETAIEAFIYLHPNFQVINLTSEVIFYDPALTVANLPKAKEQTFDFSDGSSVVLIGLPPAIDAQHHPLAH